MIIDLQRRLSEIGRIRIGQQVRTEKGTRPAKLDTFRLTSPDRRRIEAAAQLYGGTPAAWKAPAGNQFEVITTTDTLKIIVPPTDMAFTQHYELWSAGGCQRRCDGVSESIGDGPCLCDPEDRECNIHTRLSVLLSDIPGLGVWRIDTQGFYAATELSAAVEVIRLAAGRGQMLPATLRLEQRSVKRAGETVKRFAVPILDIGVSPAQLLTGRAGFDPLDAGTIAVEAPKPVAALTPVPDTVPEQPARSVAEQALSAPVKRKRSQLPVPTTGLVPRTAAQAAQDQRPPEPEPEPEPEPPEDQPEPVRPAQLKKLAILFRERGFDDTQRQDRLDYCIAAIGRSVASSKELTKDEASKVIDSLET